MPTEITISEGGKRFTDEDADMMDRRVGVVAASWRRCLRCDPSLSVDDLEQELRLWYWIYWRAKGHPQFDSKIRQWARAIMRSWGYRGDNNGNAGPLHCDRVERERSFSRSPLTREHDLTDEEILDRFQYQLETGLRSNVDGEE